MQKPFTRILVPVAFNKNTRWSVKIATQLANKFGCDLLFVHVYNSPVTMHFFSEIIYLGTSGKTDEADAREKMKKLEIECRTCLEPGLILETRVLDGNWQSVIKDLVISTHVDLVLIPRGTGRTLRSLLRSININKLAQQSRCPVLTITKDFDVNLVANIVVPIRDRLPIRKLTIANYLSMVNSGCVYLVGEESSLHSAKGDGNLLRAYRLLNGLGKVNIRCAVRNSHDTADETLAYARDIKADLIVVHAGRESLLRGLWNKIRGKYLCRESDIPVMTVAF